MKQAFSPSKSQLDRFEKISKLIIDLTKKSLKVKYDELTQLVQEDSVQEDSNAFDKWLDKSEKELEKNRDFLELYDQLMIKAKKKRPRKYDEKQSKNV